ncbi:MAG: ABC transporter permease [Acidothermaceae bacterium]
MSSIELIMPVRPGPDHRSRFRNRSAYAQIVRARLRTSLIYRQNVLFLLLVTVVQIFILRKVWTALYDGRASAAGLSIHAMIVYITLASMQNWVMQDPTVMFYMYNRIREGKIAFDLMRPVGFVPQMFAQLAGSTISSCGFVVCALPIVAFTGALDAPASMTAVPLYVVSLAAGWTTTMLLTLILAMIGFWTLEVQGLTMLYLLVGQFFAGVLVPLPLFPTPLRILAEALPFQSTAYTPVSIFVGRLTGWHAVVAIGVQLAWIAGLGLLTSLIWRRALHRVVVQGG